jgi:hypothetical protein
VPDDVVNNWFPLRGCGVQFTIRSLMIGVLAVAGLLGLARVRPDLLPVVMLVGIPIVALVERLAHVPPHRPAWRVWIWAAVVGFVILGGGWLWARSATWYFQRQEGFIAIGGAHRSEYYQLWGSAIPCYVTGVGLVVCLPALILACVRRRRRGLLWLILPYAAWLAVAWLILFADLNFEAFD